MARLREQPARNHAALLKDIGNYFLGTETWRIDPSFVVEFSPYIHNLCTDMLETGGTPAITDAIRTIVGRVSLQCYKIEQEALDAEYFADFITVGRLLKYISENV